MNAKKLGDALGRAATAAWDGDKVKLRDALNDASAACAEPEGTRHKPAPDKIDPPSA